MSGEATADDPLFPAYGPVESVLGYVLFYHIVDYVTPTVTDGLTDVLTDIAPSLVGLALAILLWVVLGLNVIEQARRQLAALGVLSSNHSPLHAWSPFGGGGQLVAAVAVVVGGGVAAVTYDTALAMITSLILLFVSLEPPSLALSNVGAMVVFFVAYGVATHALDRLVIDAARAVLDGPA